MAAATATWNLFGRCPMGMVDAMQNEESSPYHPRAGVSLGRNLGRNPWCDRTGRVRAYPRYMVAESTKRSTKRRVVRDEPRIFAWLSHARTWQLERAQTRVQPRHVPKVALGKSSARCYLTFGMRHVHNRAPVQGQSCRQCRRGVRAVRRCKSYFRHKCREVSCE